MKKLIAICAAMVLTLASLTACGDAGNPIQSENKSNSSRSAEDLLAEQLELGTHYDKEMATTTSTTTTTTETTTAETTTTYVTDENGNIIFGGGNGGGGGGGYATPVPPVSFNLGNFSVNGESFSVSGNRSTIGDFVRRTGLEPTRGFTMGYDGGYTEYGFSFYGNEFNDTSSNLYLRNAYDNVKIFGMTGSLPCGNSDNGGISRAVLVSDSYTIGGVMVENYRFDPSGANNRKANFCGITLDMTLERVEELLGESLCSEAHYEPDDTYIYYYDESGNMLMLHFSKLTEDSSGEPNEIAVDRMILMSYDALLASS